MDVYGTALRLVCALPWPQHVSATCNCDHGTMLLAGCSDRRITAWATSSIFSRSPGPFAEWKTLRKPSTSFSLQSTLTCLPVDFARCGTHHVQVFLRYCQHAMHHAIHQPWFARDFSNLPSGQQSAAFLDIRFGMPTA